MILLAAVGPKIFINSDARYSDEMVLWQEHNRIVVSSVDADEKFDSVGYEITWENRGPVATG